MANGTMLLIGSSGSSDMANETMLLIGMSRYFGMVQYAI